MNLGFQPVDARLMRMLHHGLGPFPIARRRHYSRVPLGWIPATPRYSPGASFQRWKVLAGLGAARKVRRSEVYMPGRLHYRRRPVFDYLLDRGALGFFIPERWPRPPEIYQRAPTSAAPTVPPMPAMPLLPLPPPPAAGPAELPLTTLTPPALQYLPRLVPLPGDTATSFTTGVTAQTSAQLPGGAPTSWLDQQFIPGVPNKFLAAGGGGLFLLLALRRGRR